MVNEIVVIIDPQKDFISNEGVYAKKHSGISQIVKAKERINKLIKFLDKNKLLIIYSDYQEDQFEKGLSICIPGTDGHKIELDVEDSNTLISKTQHSCFSSDEFNRYLKTNNIGKIVLCGVLAEYCVKQTAIDGLAQAYEIVLIEDCIATGDDVQDRKKKMLSELIEKGAEIVNSRLYLT